MRRKRAFALIVVLWIVAIMGTITMMFSRQARLSLKINRNSTEATQAELLAEAGIHHMMGALVQDALETLSDNEKESWCDNQASFFNAALGKGVYTLIHPNLEEKNAYRYGAEDECGKININVATKEMLMQLPNAVEPVVEAVLDWRDNDDNPQTYGAEIDYYQSLAEPYSPKNDNFDSIDELLLVKDMTVDILYGEDTNGNGILDANENDGAKNYPLDNNDGILDYGWRPFITYYSYEKNVDKNGSTRININSADKDSLTQNFQNELSEEEINSIVTTRDQNQFQSIGDLLGNDGGGGGRGGGGGVNLSKEKFKAIADRITISDEDQLIGRVNINTAPPQVLRCLLPNNEDIVENILEYRQSDQGPFEDIGQLVDVAGISNNQIKQLINLVCTKSSVFSMRSIGSMPATKAYKEIFALFDRGSDPVQIRYWKVLR
ncbi:MAG: helix-hairpin-helix domain-containing protein [Candidatus Omnitrophota bacterium]